MRKTTIIEREHLFNQKVTLVPVMRRGVLHDSAAQYC